MAGQWHEQSDNQFQWVFAFKRNSSTIWRTDGFVSGKFHRENSSWIGKLKWGNGEVSKDVLLMSTSDCAAIRTNQSWWFMRR
jgi:hypothetical protein